MNRNLIRYVVGRLDLGFVNGPNEGLTLFMILLIVSGLFTNNIWIQSINSSLP